MLVLGRRADVAAVNEIFLQLGSPGLFEAGGEAPAGRFVRVDHQGADETVATTARKQIRLNENKSATRIKTCVATGGIFAGGIFASLCADS